MKKLLLLLFLIPNLVMANPLCHENFYTEDKRDKTLNNIINILNERYISMIEIPPPHEIKKMDAVDIYDKKSFREFYNNKFYPAYDAQKQFSEVKESLRYSPSEMINLLKLSMNLQDMREALLLYKERNSTSDLEISDINYHFVFLNDIIMSIGQCAAKVKYHFYP